MRYPNTPIKGAIDNNYIALPQDFPNTMNREQMLLLLLIEECQEVSQRASKAIRFGMDEVQPDQPNGETGNNRERLLREFNDLLAVMEMLSDEGHFGHDGIFRIPEWIEEKKKKIEKYLEYSKECGVYKP